VSGREHYLLKVQHTVYIRSGDKGCTANHVDELSAGVERVAAVGAGVASGGKRNVQLGLLAPRELRSGQGDVVVVRLSDVHAVLLPLERLEVAHVALHREVAALANREVASVFVNYVA